MLFKLARDHRVKSLFDVAGCPFQLQKGRGTIVDSPIPVHIHCVEELRGSRLLAHRKHNMFLDCGRRWILRVFVRFDDQLVTIDVQVLVGGE